VTYADDALPKLNEYKGYDEWQDVIPFLEGVDSKKR
jgi:hypothetical protein